MHVKLGKTVLEIKLAQYTDIKADALVFPSNNYFWMGSNITNAIKKDAGAVVEKEAMQQGPVELGVSVVTTAGSLPYECLIHSACMGQDGHIMEQSISPSTKSALEQAESKRCSSVAVIPFITEHSQVSPYTVAQGMIESIITYCLGKTGLTNVTIITDDEDIFTIFKDRLGKFFSRK